MPDVRSNIVLAAGVAAFTLLHVRAWEPAGRPAPAVADDHSTRRERRDLPKESGTIGDRIARYENPRRAEWQRPDEVIRSLDLPKDAAVVDLGAGSGYFSVRLARAVPQGRVLALDVEPAFTAHVAERARREGLANLEARGIASDDPGLPAESADVVLLVDVYPFLPRRPAYLGKLRSALRPGGRLVVINLGKGAGPGSPYPTREKIVGEAASAGFTLLREHGTLPKQYFLEFGAP